jgi:hypothetical protein
MMVFVVKKTAVALDTLTSLNIASTALHANAHSKWAMRFVLFCFVLFCFVSFCFGLIGLIGLIWFGLVWFGLFFFFFLVLFVLFYFIFFHLSCSKCQGWPRGKQEANAQTR